MGGTLREFKDVIAVWALNIMGYLWTNFDIIFQRISVLLAIIYTLLRLYDWLRDKMNKKGK